MNWRLGNGLKQIQFSFKRKTIDPGIPAETSEDYGEPCLDELPELPPVPEDLPGTIVDRYWLEAPYSSAFITEGEGPGLKYQVVEPPVSSHELLLLEETHDFLRDVTIFDTPAQATNLTLKYEDVKRIIRRLDATITDERLRILYYYLRRNFLGYGRVEPLMHDPFLEDISCNGPDIPVYVYHRHHANLSTNLIFADPELNRYVLKLAQKADKQVSLSTPLIDAALPDGSRAQITYYDVVSTRGSSFTIRKFRAEPMNPLDLMRYHTYNPELLAFIWLAVENRRSMIIAGGTACGKTSTMNAISFFIPHQSKIVSIEDTREIQLPHENWLPVQTRQTAGLSSKGDIDMFELLRASLRQRPEYIVVGEVRGREAQTLFQAMNTGHTTFSTLHAGSIEETINRLINEPINVPPAMFGALDLIVIQSLHYKGGHVIRRCDALHEISVDREGRISWQTLWEWNPRTDEFVRTSASSKTLEHIGYMHGWGGDEAVKELGRRTVLLTRMKEEGGYDPAVLSQSSLLIWREEFGASE